MKSLEISYSFSHLLKSPQVNNLEIVSIHIMSYSKCEKRMFWMSKS